MKYKIIIPIEEPKEVLCGEANKFYRCITCDAPCGSEGHYIEVTEEQSNNDMNKILWISNNPQCKLIESCYNSLSKKCICPKEEPKQDLEKEMFELEQELDIPSSMRWHNSKPKQEIKLEDIFNDEKKQGVKDLIDAHKQETIKEAAERLSELQEGTYTIQHKTTYQHGFIDGAKYQAERMYSEEDMRGMYDKSCGLIGLSLLNDQTENDSRFKKLLEQFKKK
jgi:DNA polymerase IIIc chi subunit